MLKRILMLALVALSFATTAIAQDKFDFYGRGPYRENVPRPSTITGYEPGQFQTPHGQVVRVIERIAAAAPDRVRVIENGQTWEYRKLYLVIVSSPENLARLDEIKANLARLADPRKIASEDEANQIARYGWNYYVRHVFDIYYAGYMDSWSSLQGAIGMTYETDGGGPRSLAIKRDDDTILTFRQGIAKHFTASIATLETAASNREAQLKDYYSFFKTGMDEGRTGQMKRVVLLPGRDPARTFNLVRNLVLQGIEVSIAREGFRSQTAHDYLGSKAAPRDFPAGAFIVDFNQPMKRLAKAHLEPDPQLDESFIKRELERRARNEARGKNVEREDHEFYDVTTWSLPLAWGVEAHWTEDAPAVKGAQVSLITDLQIMELQKTPSRGPATQERKGEGLHLGNWTLIATDGQAIQGTTGGVEGGRANTAYIIPYGSDSASKLVIALLGEGYKIAVATRQLNAGGRNWPAGTLIARVHRNTESLHDRINALARTTGVQVFTVNSAFSEEGDTGVGSENVVSLKQPRVAVVWDDATSPTSYGAMWYTFERAYGLQFTPISIDALKAVDLLKFNCIIFPDGSAAQYESQLGKSAVDKLKSWVRGGGVLVGIEGGASLFTRKEVELSSSRIVGSDDDTEKGLTKPAEATPQPLTQTGGVTGPVPSDPASQKKEETKPKEKRTEAEAAVKPEEKPAPKKLATEPIAVPGAAFRARINRDHFLSYGYNSDSMVVMMDGGAFFRPSKEGANVVSFNADGRLAVSGFTWPDNTENLLRGTSFVIDEQMGRGHVIMFTEDPNFRFLWRTSAQMFLNSILLAPTLR